ncbi:MAG: diaminopimelate epimerase [Pseudomonadota bacterium]
MSIAFTKMHGLGNDIMIIDATEQTDAVASLNSGTVGALGDRRTGVGFDQLMVIEPPADQSYTASYRIFNGDGSSALQCGNGVRCVAAYLARKRALPLPAALTLEGPTGIVHCEVFSAGEVSVILSEPSFAPEDLPFDAGAQPGPVYSLPTALGPTLFTALSVGNPHAVLQVDDVDTADVANIGSALNDHSAFPEGVNVEFVQIISPERIRLRVFERGVGETRACGSGACAAVAALRRREQIGDSVQVTLPGGTLMISWRATGEPITMSGPVETVFEGNLTT